MLHNYIRQFIVCTYKVATKNQYPVIGIPIFTGLGILFSYYYGYDMLALALIMLVIGCAIAWKSQHKWYSLFICSFALGFLSMAILVQYYQQTPVLKEKLSPRTIIGRLADIEPISPKQSYIFLDQLYVHGYQLDGMTVRMKVPFAWMQSDIKIGQHIKIYGVLSPLPGKILPDGYNMSAHFWLAGIRALGFGLSRPKLIDRPLKYTPLSTLDSIKHAIGNKRMSLLRHIVKTIGHANGSLTASIITGHVRAIPRQIQEEFRQSGLTHLLVISGFNIGLLCFFIIQGTRLFLTLFPSISQVYDTKKIGAVLALVGALFYCLISGASIPTQRAFVVSIIALIGILSSRPCFSIHTFSISATALLLLFPDSLFSISFQLSFSAVLSLIFGYQVFKPWLKKPSGIFSQVAYYMLMIALTTVLCSVSTNIISLFHFQKVALISPIANVFAVPIASLWMTPLSLLYLLAHFFSDSLSELVLFAIEPSVAYLHFIARYFSVWGVLWYPPVPQWLFTIAICGGLFVCLYQGKVRYIGLLLVASEWIVPFFASVPQMMIVSGGDSWRNVLIAWQKNDAIHIWPANNKNRFIKKVLQGYYGSPTNSVGPAVEQKITEGKRLCSNSCKSEDISFIIITQDQKDNALCGGVDIVINLSDINCRGDDGTVVIDKKWLEKHNSIALTKASGNITANRGRKHVLW